MPAITFCIDSFTAICCSLGFCRYWIGTRMWRSGAGCLAYRTSRSFGYFWGSAERWSFSIAKHISKDILLIIFCRFSFSVLDSESCLGTLAYISRERTLFAFFEFISCIIWLVLRQASGTFHGFFRLFGTLFRLFCTHSIYIYILCTSYAIKIYILYVGLSDYFYYLNSNKTFHWHFFDVCCGLIMNFMKEEYTK